jgi:hypothetical protein
VLPLPLKRSCITTRIRNRVVINIGFSWCHFLQARQTTGVGNKNFESTSKTRVAHTYDELTKFANALRKFDKEATAHLNSVKGALSLAAPAPSACV